MKSKKNWLGMLIIALVFGMTVVGCEEEEESDIIPSPPTGLKGTCISPNNSIQLTWNPVDNAGTYDIEYKENSSSYSYWSSKEIENTSYTYTDLKYETEYDFRVRGRNPRSGHPGDYSSPITVKTGSPLTGSISLDSLTTTEFKFMNILTPYYSYSIDIQLKLSNGAYWNSFPVETIAKQWVTNITGLNLSSWDFKVDSRGVGYAYLKLSYSISTQSSPIVMPSGGITVSINTTKLTEMKGYTNIINSLSIGTPSSVSSSEWGK